ncbi:hypothetical protein OIU85_016792 [Salix viminalis]|uniref:Legume lectin domain-containing protein n=1 Tax=Salix viminalis TaxID=40686 RepID=A0A9Q0V6S1_SALVM|nr:hypothetical protein OIU85_016792 [Salix viminalis]
MPVSMCGFSCSPFLFHYLLFICQPELLKAFEKAIASLIYTLGEESYKDSTHLLRDNITLWTSDVQVGASLYLSLIVVNNSSARIGYGFSVSLQNMIDQYCG